MLTRIVLDYQRDRYVFPDGKVVPRTRLHLLDGSFSLKVGKDANLAEEVEKFLKTKNIQEDSTHYQAYATVRSEDSITYSLYFLRFTGEAEFVHDLHIREEQATLYRIIAG